MEFFRGVYLPLGMGNAVKTMKQLPLWKRPIFARRILDIGAGHNPFKGITHLLELDIDEGRHRGGKSLVLPHSAALVVGDATALPFQERVFDYVYASHVLEHVDVPEKACRELIRIGSAGYIETPSPFLEQGLAFSKEDGSESSLHKWFVFSPTDNLLVFEPKTQDTERRFCSCRDGQFMKDFYTAVDFHRAQHCFRRAAKTTMFYWKRRFRVEVRHQAVDCDWNHIVCRFSGMKQVLLRNCNDWLRINRILQLKKTFPECTKVFRRYGYRTLVL